MTYTETMKQGSATVRRTSSKNIMRVLVEVIESDPTADNERRFRTWSEAVKDDDDLLSAALRHVFTNLNSALEKHQSTSARQSAPKTTAAPAAVESVKDKIRSIVLLDLIMSNGKKLKYCNKGDCLKQGGWLTTIGKNLKQNQTVGQAFNETDLQKMFKEARS